MRPKSTRARRSHAGQSTVEYMLLVSVLVLAMVAVTRTLVPGLESGLQSMSSDVQGMASDGYVGGGR